MSIIQDKLVVQTVSRIKKRKNEEPIVMITAYDALFANLFDSHVDIILVGDSLHMSFGGAADTLSATMEIMLYHTKAVCKGVKHALVVTDMPFASYTTPEDALFNASRVYRETMAHAIKIEGGANHAPLIKHLVDNGIAVMGHIGLLPQNVRADGGYKVKGKTKEEEASLVRDAKALQDAGVFCIVIEGVVSEVASRVAKSVNIPLVGIGAGNEVDGQVLVWSDAFGFFKEFKPKFVKQYLKGASLVEEAVKDYANDVKTRAFPDASTSY
ncbi:MAG: 3-methyl-2-oxobutanoate hydroxymethyltransferase [Campylobacteraceae bacterium]|nr:3-methyl-2-oxobutanoate hydroxymethyltransferase [Campylobacteraceae bacterium]